MTRIFSLFRIVIAIIYLPLFLFSCNSVNSEQVKPNIILILADDLGYGDLGCYGQTKINTPNIDNLASEGIKFTNFYAGSTVCAPSRSCLLTGQHTGHTTVRGNMFNKKRIPLTTEDATIASVLKSSGYKTAIFGKWGLGEPGSTGIPNLKGFDNWLGYLNQHNAHYYYPEFLWKNEEKVILEKNLNEQRGTYTHDLFISEALNFIDNNKDSPFFLYLPVTIPHAELVVPPEVLEEYKGKFEEIPFEGSKDFIPNNYPRATYAAMISYLDKGVGEIVSKIDALNLSENTIIIFTSDNGPEANGKHGCDPEYFNSSGQLKGVKRDLYEGGIRVPLVVKWKGVIEPGQVTDYVSAFWDFLPTLSDAAGVSGNYKTDGVSFYPTLLGNVQEDKQDFLYWEFYEDKSGPIQAVRHQNWKFIKYCGLDKIELYDLDTDIGETIDIANKHPEIINTINNYLDTVRSESPYWNITDESTKTKI